MNDDEWVVWTYFNDMPFLWNDAWSSSKENWIRYPWSLHRY
jgi:hypothetical protein